MTIYRPIEKHGVKKFDAYNIPSDYWCAGWLEGSETVVLITSESEFISPPNSPNARPQLDGVAVETKYGWEAFINEVENVEGKTIPPELLEENDIN